VVQVVELGLGVFVPIDLEKQTSVFIDDGCETIRNRLRHVPPAQDAQDNEHVLEALNVLSQALPHIDIDDDLIEQEPDHQKRHRERIAGEVLHMVCCHELWLEEP